jgi:hypothetical protein
VVFGTLSTVFGTYVILRYLRRRHAWSEAALVWSAPVVFFLVMITWLFVDIALLIWWLMNREARRVAAVPES